MNAGAKKKPGSQQGNCVDNKVFDLYRAEGRILCFDEMIIALFHQKSNARTCRLTHRYSSYLLVPASKSLQINLFSVKEAPFIQVSEEKK